MSGQSVFLCAARTKMSGSERNLFVTKGQRPFVTLFFYPLHAAGLRQQLLRRGSVFHIGIGARLIVGGDLFQIRLEKFPVRVGNLQLSALHPGDLGSGVRPFGRVLAALENRLMAAQGDDEPRGIPGRRTARRLQRRGALQPHRIPGVRMLSRSARTSSHTS